VCEETKEETARKKSGLYIGKFSSISPSSLYCFLALAAMHAKLTLWPNLHDSEKPWVAEIKKLRSRAC
jgi:hypothetical protein